MVVLPVILLAGIGLGILYVRLANGPVAINFLARPIVDALNAELGDLRVDVGSAMMQVEGRHVEFQLKDLRILDRSNATVAVAPLAAFELSRKAFMAGRLRPSRVVLIRPKLLAFYSAENGLTLRFAGAGRRGDKAAAVQTADAGSPIVAPRPAPAIPPRPPQPGQTGNGAFSRIDLAQTIAAIARKARARDHAASFLDKVGLRDATVVLDRAGKQSTWLVPAATIELAHFDKRSLLLGEVTVASRKGPWRLLLRAEDSESTGSVKLNVTARDLHPETLAEDVPELAALGMIKAPIQAAVDVSLSNAGEVLGGNAVLELSPGQLHLPLRGLKPPALQSGRIQVSYWRGRRSMIVAPSKLRWSNSELSFSGSITPPQPDKAITDWTFDLKSAGGGLSPEANWRTVSKLEQWSAKGRIRSSDGAVALDQVVMQAGGGGAVLSGVIQASDRVGYDLKGTVGAMPAAALLLYWPTFLAPEARAYYAGALRGGKFRGGRFKAHYSTPSGATASTTDKPDWSTTLDFEFAEVRFAPHRTAPEVYAPQSRLRLLDDRIIYELPKGAFVIGERELAAIAGLRFEAAKIYADEVDGRITTRLTSTVENVVQLAEARAFGLAPLPKELREKVVGKVDARLEAVMPIVRPGASPLPSPQVTGQVRILDARAPGLVAGHDVSGAAVLIDLGDKVVNARGKMLVGGIPAALSWQHIIGGAPEKQPPLRITATLDQADRVALGMAINHIVQGEIGLDITLQPQAGIAGGIHVRADLTKADVMIESLAWRKTVGKEASVEFDVAVKNKIPAALTNIRMASEGVAVEGKAELGRGGRITSFDFPLFSINFVSRLQLRGERRKGDLWRVSVRGQTFEGRDFFRALFSAGNLRPDDDRSKTADPGLDLDVRVASVLGFWNTRMTEVAVDLSKRKGRLTALVGYGTLKSGKKLSIRVADTENDAPRRLIAVTDDAGSAFELVGFYPNARGGRMQLAVNLDGDGRAEKTGVLEVRQFEILGDPVVNEFVSVSEQGTQGRRQTRARQQRQVIGFDWMRVPFSVGNGQFVLHEAELRGPLLGAVLRGKANFESRRMSLGGTYVPLQGLNSAIGAIPGLGQLLAGPRGEGILGMTFAIQGSMANPEFFIHPLSLVAPGIFREMFQLTNPTPNVTPRKPTRRRAPSNGGSGWRTKTLSPTDN